MTGEISIRGKVMPVGGIVAKVEAARQAGARRVIIPKGNYQEIFSGFGIDVIAVEDISTVIELVIGKQLDTRTLIAQPADINILTANGINNNTTTVQAKSEI
jgi:Lon-like ATP-dependent protease